MDSPDRTDDPDPLRSGSALLKCSSRLGPSRDLARWGGVIGPVPPSTNDIDLLSDSRISCLFLCFSSIDDDDRERCEPILREFLKLGLEVRCASQTLRVLISKGLSRGRYESARRFSSSMAVAALDRTENRSE